MNSRDSGRPLTLLIALNSEELRSAIEGGVKQALDAHDANDKCFVKSATKRIIGQLKMIAKRNK